MYFLLVFHGSDLTTSYAEVHVLKDIKPLVLGPSGVFAFFVFLLASPKRFKIKMVEIKAEMISTIIVMTAIFSENVLDSLLTKNAVEATNRSNNPDTKKIRDIILTF